MTKLVVVLSLALFSASFAGAADITLKDGRVLRNAVLVRHDAATVTFRHAAGFTQIEKSKLPEALAAEYPLDVAEAKVEAEQQKQEVLARRAEAERLFALRVQLAAATPKPVEVPVAEQPSTSTSASTWNTSWTDSYNAESWRLMRIRARQDFRDRDYGHDRDDRSHGRDRDYGRDRHRDRDPDCATSQPSPEIRFTPNVHMTSGSKAGELTSTQSTDEQSEDEKQQWARQVRRF